MEGLATLIGGFGVFFFIFALVLAIAWIIVPFAIIGTKPILRDVLEQQRRTNELLSTLERRLQGSNHSSHSPPQFPQSATAAPSLSDVAVPGVRKGRCPNCGAINLLESIRCSKCGALFDSEGGWKLEPLS